MARKSKIKSVGEFLENEKTNNISKMFQEMNLRDFVKAEIYNQFDNILTKAIQLCGEEKPKESKLEH